jgi:multidrug efflux system outer membrane protein
MDQAEARKQQSLANYEQVIQNAFRDVDDSLVAVKQTAEFKEALGRRVATLRRGVELANERYENGYSDYLEVLDTERSLFSAELQYASARGDYQRALVNLYRALGGDWTAVPPSAANAGGRK